MPDQKSFSYKTKDSNIETQATKQEDDSWDLNHLITMQIKQVPEILLSLFAYITMI